MFVFLSQRWFWSSSSADRLERENIIWLYFTSTCIFFFFGLIQRNLLYFKKLTAQILQELLSSSVVSVFHISVAKAVRSPYYALTLRWVLELAFAHFYQCRSARNVIKNRVINLMLVAQSQNKNALISSPPLHKQWRGRVCLCAEVCERWHSPLKSNVRATSAGVLDASQSTASYGPSIWLRLSSREWKVRNNRHRHPGLETAGSTNTFNGPPQRGKTKKHTQCSKEGSGKKPPFPQCYSLS